MVRKEEEPVIGAKEFYSVRKMILHLNRGDSVENRSDEANVNEDRQLECGGVIAWRLVPVP